MKLFSADFKKYQDLILNTHREKFDCFRNLILQYNEKFNLTAITKEEEIFYKHFLDSVAGESFFPEGANVCEIGSGAGFPSIPLKLIREDLKFTLIESTMKKCEFLQTVIDELALTNMSVVNARAEDLGKKREFRESFDVCCARAVAAMNALSEYCLPLLKTGGKMIAYKGNSEEECKQAEKAISLLGGKIEERYCYDLPEGMGERSIIVVHKIKNTPAKYPRGRGLERSRPIL